MLMLKFLFNCFITRTYKSIFYTILSYYFCFMCHMLEELDLYIVYHNKT